MLNLEKVYLSSVPENERIDGIVGSKILAGNGTFQKRKSWLGYRYRQLDTNGTEGQPDMAEDFVIIPNNFPKLPLEALATVIEWYRKITLDNGEEAQINFYRMKQDVKLTHDGVEKEISEIPGIKIWSEELFSYTPIQVNNTVHTSANDPIYDELNLKFGLYLETHSHNSMGAFKSGEDRANSNNDGMQLVFGHLNTKEIQMYSWATMQNIQKDGFNIETLSHFVEFPEDVTEKGKEDDYHLYFNIDTIDNVKIDTDLLKEWDNQILKYNTHIVEPEPTYFNQVIDSELEFSEDLDTSTETGEENIYLTSSYIDKFYNPFSRKKRSNRKK